MEIKMRQELNELRDSTVANATVIKDMGDDLRSHIVEDKRDREFSRKEQAETNIKLSNIEQKLADITHPKQKELCQWVESQIAKDQAWAKTLNAIQEKVLTASTLAALGAIGTLIWYSFTQFIDKT